MKKSESEDESEQKVNIVPIEVALLEDIAALNKRVLALEKALIHAQHTNTDDGSRHKDDGGVV